MKYKLLVFPNFQGFKRCNSEEGRYILMLPHAVIKDHKRKVLFGHVCSDLNWAIRDLQYPSRTDFLNQYFGIGNWEFEVYEKPYNKKEFTQYCKDISQECDLDKLEEQFTAYRDGKIHL